MVRRVGLGVLWGSIYVLFDFTLIFIIVYSINLGWLDNSMTTGQVTKEHLGEWMIRRLCAVDQEDMQGVVLPITD